MIELLEQSKRSKRRQSPKPYEPKKKVDQVKLEKDKGKEQSKVK